jgi:hypothetical protein
MKRADKGYNRRFLLKLRVVKFLFYPFIILLEKTGLASLLIRPIDRVTDVLGIGKSIREFWKYKDYGKLFRNDFKEPSRSGKVLLFPSFLGVNSNYTMLNLLFAKHFLKSDIEPVFLVCRSSVPVCQKENVFKTRKHNPFLCHECHNGYAQLSRETGIRVVYLDSLIDSSLKNEIERENSTIDLLLSLEECRGYSYKGVPLGQHTYKTVLRYYLKGSISGTDDEVEIFRKYLKSTLIVTLVNKKFFRENTNVEYSIIHNGTLVFETITRLLCEEKGVPYMTYENYMGKNTIIYRKNGEIMNFDWGDEFSRFKMPESFYPEMEEKVSRLFSELQVGKHAFGVLNREAGGAEKATYKDYVCLFTNVNFDTAVIGKHTIFNDMPDWLNAIVEYWSENVKDIQLVIRVHPAEIVMRSASQEFMGDYLKRIVKSSNITIIDSTEEKNSYDLISGMKYGLVYSSTIGMEIAYRNKICVVAGKPYYRGKPFVISPLSREEYFNTLTELNNGRLNFTINRQELVRFVYFVFHIRLKYLNGIVIYTIDSEPNTSFVSSEEMLANNSEFLSDFQEELYDRARGQLPKS